METNHSYQNYPQKKPHDKQGMAIAAMVLGILAVIVPYVGFVLGIIAIVMAVKTMKQIPPNTPGGARGMAITGLVCGIVGVAFYGIVILIFIVVGSFAAMFYF